MKTKTTKQRCATLPVTAGPGSLRRPGATASNESKGNTRYKEDEI